MTQLELTKNRLSDWTNHVLLPQSLVTLIIDYNPIRSISNYQFAVSRCISLNGCNITSLTNVAFNAEHVFLADNPIQIIKNVAFGRRVDMSNCGITLSTLKEFEFSFVQLYKGQFSELILSNNNITKEQLEAANYKLPEGLTRIVLDRKMTINETEQTYP